MAQQMSRSLPVRVSLVVLSVVLYGFTVIADGLWGVGLDTSADLLKWVLGVVGVTIAGDTWRPSGWLQSAPSESPGVDSDL